MTAATRHRQLIRQTVKTLITDALSYMSGLAVTTQMRVDIPEGHDHAVSVFFLKGDVDEGYYRDDDAVLAIRIITSSQQDPQEELDGLADSIENVIATDVTLGGIVQHATQKQWQYQPDDTGRHILALLYDVNYQTNQEQT
ncbi:phage tail terminator protein [Neptunomonas phycophila]|uniref:phage tail terminator protein n=1 Tax=Neptunomonas phycophila TaxID=1572645 RepID=UPI0037354BF6